MEFLSPVLNEVEKGLWNLLQRRIAYLVHYKRNIHNLRKQIENLEAKKIDLQKLIEEAERQLEKPTEKVKIWLKEANDRIEEAIRSIEAGEEGRNKYWLKGYFSKWNSRYNKSKEAINQVLAIKELQYQVDSITRVSHPPSPPNVIPFPSDDIVESKSMRLTLDQVMEALQDESVTTIGVHGIGGVGKTTLMKKLNNELQTSHLFKTVIIITVSSEPDPWKIQDEITKRLGLKLEDKSSTHERANQLSMRMKEVGAMLLILDDMWKRLELSDVGIPNINERSGHKGHCCKIIITSRFSNVCDQMGAQKKIGMNLLSDEESWILFKKKTGNVVDSPTLKPLAEQVMRECRGLPLAIVAVGLTLRMVDNSSIWSDALRSLKSSDLGELHGDDIPSMISSLKFSYDYLKNDDIKLCFLFCCLFREDEDILLEDNFLGYGIGEGLGGFLKVTGGFYEAFNRLVSIIHRLKNCGLLLQGENAKSVKMHDVVRDVAISIAKTDGHGFLVKAGLGLKEWPQFENIEQCKRISLMWNDLRELPNELVCPNLRTLLLQGNRNLNNIPSDFFNSLSSLVVLDLSFTSITSLPQSLSRLTNLRTLYLNSCDQLHDCSLLGGLKKLLVLSLRSSGINELPVAFGELSHLKFLDVSYVMLELIPSGILSQLSELECLRMEGVMPARVLQCEGRGCGEIAFWKEIASMPSLMSLFITSRYHSVDLPYDEYLFEDILGVPWPKLNSFCVDVGTKLKRYSLWEMKEKERTMHLHISSPKYMFANWVNVLLERTQALYLTRCEGIRSIERLEVIAGSKYLEWLRLEECSEMKWLVDYTDESVPHCLFANLEKLELVGLWKMRKIYRGLLPISGQSFENLRSLKLQKCHNLRTIFSYNFTVRLHNLEELEVQESDKLREVFQYRKCGGELDQQHHQHGTNVEYGHSLLQRELDVIKIEDGEEDEEEDDGDSENEETEIILAIHKGILPRLRELCFKGLPKLRCFYSRNVHFDLQSLEILEIIGCPNLRTLPFGPDTAPNLKVIRCEEKWFNMLSWDSDGIESRLRSRIQTRPIHVRRSSYPNC